MKCFECDSKCLTKYIFGEKDKNGFESVVAVRCIIQNVLIVRAIMASISFSLCPVSYLDTRGFGLEMMKNETKRTAEAKTSL
jgi:hypothetical protein